MRISNQRYQSTEDRIQRAFFLLLKRRNINDIYVKDICIEAGIHRSSFYSHYVDINDFMIKLETKISNQIMNVFDDDNINSSNFIKFFEMVREYKDFYTAFFKSQDGDGMRHGTFLNYEKRLRSRGKFPYVSEDLRYHMSFFGAGLQAVAKQWVLSGCKESPEKMAQIIFDEYKMNAKYFRDID